MTNINEMLKEIQKEIALYELTLKVGIENAIAILNGQCEYSADNGKTWHTIPTQPFVQVEEAEYYPLNLSVSTPNCRS